METITIGLTGDVMTGRLVNDHLPRVSPEYIWGDILSEFLKTDLNIINLETALTLCETPVPKVFNFKTDPKYVQSLKRASIDAVNLANNHVLDFTGKGLFDTLDTLDEAHILHTGAGRNLAEAKRPIIIEKKGIRTGILGCTDNEPGWIASHDHCGIRYVEVGDIAAIREDILTLRPRVDILVLSMHWGPNMRERPNNLHKDFARQLLDLGVDILHGHSAHIFQGVEVYKNKLILYDTGDFIDDYHVDPVLRNDRSFFFKVTVDKKGVRELSMIPTLISHFQVNKSTGNEAMETMERMRQLCKEMNTSLQFVDDQLILRLPLDY